MDYKCGPIPSLKDWLQPPDKFRYQLYDPEYYPGDPVPAELVYAENPTLSDIPELYELTEVLLIVYAKGFYQRWSVDRVREGLLPKMVDGHDRVVRRSNLPDDGGERVLHCR
jgi:hypothetical protein